MAYPFGHGLSYTAFAYGEVSAEVAASGDVTVTVPVTNTGERDGREVVQVYVGLDDSVVERAPRELKAFASVEIPAGETREVVLTVRRDDLAYWDIRVERFVVEGGRYRIEAGASSRDLRTETAVEVAGDEVRIPLSEDSSIAEAAAHPVVGATVREALAGFGSAGGDGDEGVGGGVLDLIGSMPLGRIAAFGASIDEAAIQQLIATANRQDG